MCPQLGIIIMCPQLGIIIMCPQLGIIILCPQLGIIIMCPQLGIIIMCPQLGIIIMCPEFGFVRPNLAPIYHFCQNYCQYYFPIFTPIWIYLVIFNLDCHDFIICAIFPQRTCRYSSIEIAPLCKILKQMGAGGVKSVVTNAL